MASSVAAVVLLAAVAASSPLVHRHDAASFGRNASLYRLSGSTVPLEYDVTLILDPAESTYRGTVSILIVATETTEAALHAHEQLNVTEHRLVRNSTGETVPSLVERSGDDRQLLRVITEERLVSGERYVLTFGFVGEFGSSHGARQGLYRSVYLDANGTIVNLVMSQFQPTSAREAFPCYDEPALKAIFRMHVYAPPQYGSVLSNMDTIESPKPPIAGLVATSFAPTPPMSTYLVAVVVADFGYSSNAAAPLYPKEFRIYARRDAIEATEFGLDFGQRTMSYMQAYADVPYRLPKVDSAAGPDAGAMENWGLVTYRNSALLRFKETSTTGDYASTATLMSHETSHFWFGDEVSPLWWDYLWLNEGFATFFSYYATDKVYGGEWRLMEQFVVDESQLAMQFDALPITNPMSNRVGSPSEIASNFNMIAYPKSAAVIRMMQLVMGEQRFRLALSNYLKSLPTGVAEPEDLFGAMQKVLDNTDVLPDGVTMSEVFGSWANQSGFPLVNANRVGGEVRLSQSRYHDDPSVATNESWWVPMTVITPASASSAWLRRGDQGLMPIAPDRWYLIDNAQTGYYRVTYDDDNWGRLAEALMLDDGLISPLSRAQLIDDSSQLAITGRLPFNVTLDILKYLVVEDDWIPWVPANRFINLLNIRMVASDNYVMFKSFIKSLVEGLYESVGFEVGQDDGYVTKKTRTLAIGLACYFGVESCSDEAQRSLAFLLGSPEADLHPDLRPHVYCSGLRGRPALWNATLERYSSAVLDDDRRMIVDGLGCVDDAIIYDRYLKMTIRNDSAIRSLDREAAIMSVAYSGPLGVEASTDFLSAEFLNLRNSVSGSSMSRIIQNLGYMISKSKEIQTFRSFSERYQQQFTSGERAAVGAALATIASSEAWIGANVPAIDAWIADNHAAAMDHVFVG